jgi:hypothetical protein
LTHQFACSSSCGAPASSTVAAAEAVGTAALALPAGASFPPRAAAVAADNCIGGPGQNPCFPEQVPKEACPA